MQSKGAALERHQWIQTRELEVNKGCHELLQRDAVGHVTALFIHTTYTTLHPAWQTGLAFIEATTVGGSCPGLELFDRARLLSITLLKS